MSNLIINIFICFDYYILGAYATTDILRLTKGNSISINEKGCYCPICHTKLKLFRQIPIFSFLVSKGTCINCKEKIPRIELFLEIFIFIIMSLITVLSHFSWYGYAICFLVYQLIKIAIICIKGIRTDRFALYLLMSFLHNIIIWLLIAFLFFLKQIL